MLPIPQQIGLMFIAISRPACTTKNKTISSYTTLSSAVCYVRRFCLYGVCADYRSLKFCRSRQSRPTLT